ncbi:MAG: ABC transporter ATP-binding protein [Epulopiscium sp.]|nr:ABC transporter ATP-binding protein [Candidatus Epulonipiscium sp.]
MTPIVDLNSVSMNYHTLSEETKAIDNLSLSVYPGEFISIVGPSGCGKSTLLSLIAGLLTPTSGKITLQNNPDTKQSCTVGYMLQKDHLFEWRNILNNVYLGLEIQGKLTPENKKYAHDLLDKYGLGDFKSYFPSQLSGGMRQRVALIRTLAVNPEILLLDEPFSALDYQTRLNVADEIGRIIKNEGKTAILVTHDISEAISMSDRVIILTQRPATVKMALPLTFSIANRTPLTSREAPEFRHYFQVIWKELNDNERKV